MKNTHIYIRTVLVAAIMGISACAFSQITHVPFSVTQDPALVASPGSPATICSGLSTVIGGSPTASGGSGIYNILWTPATGLSSPTVANPTASPATSTSYDVLVTDANNCQTSSTVFLTVNPLPAAAGTITGTATVCQNQTGVVYNIPAITDATDYFWSLPTGASIASGSNTNSIIVNYSGAATSGNITVYGTNSCGNGTVSANYAVTVNQTPTTANAGADQNLCNSTTATLAGNTPATGTGNWTVVSGSATITNPSLATSTITGLVAGTSATLGWTISNGICTPSIDEVVITNNPEPAISSETKTNVTVCGGNDGTITIVASGTPPLEYSIDGGITYVSNGGIFTGLFNGGYPVAVKNSFGCIVNGSTLIIVDGGAPASPVAGTDASYCEGTVVSNLFATAGSGGSLTWYSNPGLTTMVGTGSSFNPNSYVSNGANHFYATETVAGCESPATVVTITVNSIDTTLQTQYICEGGSYDFFGTPLTVSGIYYHTLTSSLSCDSVIQLSLSVNPVDTTLQSQTICEGTNYNFYGTPLTVSGIYYHTLTSSLSCDSVIQLSLSVNPVDTTLQSQAICEGTNYNFYGTPLTASGTYYHTLTSSLLCDSVIKLSLIVNPVDTTLQSQTICEGSNYNFFGTPLTTAGNYYHTLASILNCDSVIKLSLTVYPVFDTTKNVSICTGQNYTLPDNSVVSIAGTYPVTLTTLNGCDSVITTNLSVVTEVVNNLSVTICNGDSAFLSGNWQTTGGTYYDTLTASGGCDSIVVTTLTVFQVYNTVINASICEGQVYTLPDNSTATITGTYPVTLASINGCDSSIVTNLIVNPVDTNLQMQVVCEDGSYDFFGTPLTASGTYYHTLTSSLLCDSVIKLSLIVNPVDTTLQSQTICEGSNYNFFGTPLTNTGIYYHTLTSILNCDSVIKLSLIVNPVDTTLQSQTICEGATFNFFGTPLSTSGIYYHTLTSSLSCDSVIKLSLVVNPVDTVLQSQTICEGANYNFFGTPLTNAGIYYHILTSALNCDSVIQLSLSVNPVDTTLQLQTICEGNNYNFFGTPLTATGTYYHTLTSSLLCDSVIQLSLTVNSVDTTLQLQTICEGGNYDFFGTPLTTAGIYYHTLTSSLSCDSVIELSLTVNLLPVVHLGNDTLLCGATITLDADNVGSTFIWNDNSTNQTLEVNTGGTYSVTVTDINGCSNSDTIVIISTTINGTVHYSGGTIPPNSAYAELYKIINTTDFNRVDTIALTGMTFQFSNVEAGEYLLCIRIDNNSFDPHVLSTYRDSVAFWSLADTLIINCGNTYNTDIHLYEITTPTGMPTGSVSGTVYYISAGGKGINAVKSPLEMGNPVIGGEIYIEIEPDDEPIANTQTDTAGSYSFSGLPEGNTYSIKVDIPGLPMISTYTFTVTAGDTVFGNLNFYVDTSATDGYISTDTLTGILLHSNSKFSVLVYPNPAQNNLTIEYSLGKTGKINIELFDMAGRKILQVVNAEQQAGKHNFTLNLTKHRILKGSYFLKFLINKSVYLKKIIIE
ncbi:MAG: T9SS type A sorting domain-containing protein [Bacteroidia bacterium]|nr:T9SS type A sorting domain-containing protein [Bacteroidia bacterium]